MATVIIIGAGLGGLTAGNWLALRGHKATIFESHSEPGGYIGGFRRKGYYFESGTLALESAAMVFGAMKDFGLREKVSFVRKHTRFVSQGLETNTKEPIEAFRDAFMRAFPSESDKLAAYFAEVGGMYRNMKPFLRETNPGLLDLVANGWGMFSAYRRYRNVTLGEFTERYFPKDSVLYRIFRMFGYPDMAAYMLGGAFATIFDGYWTVAEGMQSWADALADNFRKAGGELLLRSKVEKILTKDGSAVGVVCGGREHRADAVIAASDYKKTFLQLLDDKSVLPAGFSSKVESARVSEGICTAYLGLDMSNDELRTAMKLSSVVFADEQPGADVNNPRDELFFEKSSVMLHSPSLYSAKLAPEGKSSLMIQAMSPTGWLDNWRGGSGPAYESLKDTVKKVFIRKASNIIPGLEARIAYSDFATPLTYERYTANSEGATSAWSWNPKKRFYDGMFTTNVETPVKRLFIGSCWATQIGGIPGALTAGRKAAAKAAACG